MQDNMKAFFDRFAEDVSSFSGTLIAERYVAPYTVVSRDGDIWLCSDEIEVVDYFQSLLDKHKAEGVARCKYEDLVFSPIGNSCFQATVTWTMMKEDGSTVSNWRESYNMIKTDDGLKIFTSIDH